MRNIKEIGWRCLLPFAKIVLKQKQKVKFERKAFFTKGTKFEGCNYVGENSILLYSELGYGSYVTRNVRLERVKVGKYTSIAPDVKTIVGDHPTSKYVSTYPAFFAKQSVSGVHLKHSNCYQELQYAEKGFHVCIGNDVWIGQGAQLKQGITIHDGAVIAAGAVVVKDVPAYSIVGGVPAKVIKYRFDEDIIQKLLQMRWWDKNKEYLQMHVKEFTDVNRFCRLGEQ